MRDTSAEIDMKMIELFARQTPTQRLAKACDMFDCAKQLVIAGLMQAQGELSKSQLRAQVFLRLYGDCFAPQERELIARSVGARVKD
jgi:hypothetical protein